MKKLLLSTVVLALTASDALAADLPTRKELLLPPPPPPPVWTGFYAGLNAGYGFGTNSNVQSASFDQSVYVANGFSGPAEIFWGGPNGELTNYNLGYGGPAIYLPTTGAGFAQTRSFSNTQSGFVGGGQVGYNYQWGQSFIIGFEADIQGSGIRGGSRGIGTASSSVDDPSRDIGEGQATYLGTSYSANAVGVSSVNAGADWLGTVRGRIGWLLTPNLLVYGTGGLTYGGVHANVTQYAISNISSVANGLSSTVNTASSLPGPTSSFNLTYLGGGQRSQVLAGWNVGGGLEWMFAPNWSLKAEGLYWNMGSINVQTATFAAAPQPGACATPGTTVDNVTGFGCAAASSYGTVGATRVNYQGVVARMGVNYHFNFGGSAPIVAKY